MSQEQQHVQRSGGGDSDEGAEFGQVQAQINTQGLDDVLDDIDSVLETNAEDFVRNFVQKGGQ